MKYQNARDVLPEYILKEVQKYIKGSLLYIPNPDEKRSWGETSGYKQKLIKRNRTICNKYLNGYTISELADEFYLSVDSVKKIVYSKRKEHNLMYEPTIESAVAFSNDGMLEEWLQSHLLFTLKNEDYCDQLKKETHTYVGVVKLPIRFIQPTDTILEQDVNLPIIVEFSNKQFHIKYGTNTINDLKLKKHNAVDAIVIYKGVDDTLFFNNNFGKHLRYVK